MNEDFDFRDLFVFDLANNHQGSVDHALAIIRRTGEVARKQGVRDAFTFQFRQLSRGGKRRRPIRTLPLTRDTPLMLPIVLDPERLARIAKAARGQQTDNAG